MSVTVQAFYPVSEGTTFDAEYYGSTHLTLAKELIGDLTESILLTKGLAGGPDVPPGFHATVTLVFADGAAMEEAMGKFGPLLEDIPNFTNSEPVMLIGESLGD